MALNSACRGYPLNNSANEHAAPKTCLWDSHYGPSTAAFSTYRKFVCGAFLPWSIERQRDDPFHGRAEGLLLPMGAIAKMKASPIIASRHRAEVENSPCECIYASYVLAGELRVQQGQHDFTAEPGDLVLYESRHPVVMTEMSAGQFECLSFRFDREQFRPFEDAEGALSCTLISAESMIAPLAACLGYLSENFLAIPVFEAVSLFNVFGPLLPVAALAITKKHETPRSDIAQRSLMRGLLDYINANLDAPDLSPRTAAAELGISLRYVHKLCAEKGMTFCGYVTSQRLDHVRKDLCLPAFRHEPIYAVAARRGFGDASAFNRIFKERFGITPGRARALCP